MMSIIERPRRFIFRPSLVAVSIGVAATALLSACGGPATSTGATTKLAATTAATRTVTTPAETKAVATPSTIAPKPAPARTGYTSARAQWKKGATAISAQQGIYWMKAESDLQNGESTDGGDTSGYATAVMELKSLVSLPDAQQTAAQNAEYHADITALNTFFKTPGLYS